ncbi:hypothetical protein LCGC14_1773250 [marine sediment metagenome]|uniref:HTH cro/C1-type domain-containing protein n=1 Tax=marine sediment metagenome TaxID=412755 RepID=A0A0F9GXM3_9ZZZZ
MIDHCFGQQVRFARLQDERSQAYIARKAGISKTHMWQIEKGTSEPGLRVALAIARALGVPIEQLVLQENSDDR